MSIAECVAEAVCAVGAEPSIVSMVPRERDSQEPPRPIAEAMKAADVHIGFLDRFSGALVIYGSVGAVEEALLQTIGGLGRLLNYTLCELTKS